MQPADTLRLAVVDLHQCQEYAASQRGTPDYPSARRRRPAARRRHPRAFRAFTLV